MRKLVTVAAVLGFGFSATLFVVRADAPYTPTEVQNLRIQVKYKDAQIAEMNAQQARVALVEEVNKVKKENGWPDSVTFDYPTQRFVGPPALPDSSKPGPDPIPAAKKP